MINGKERVITLAMGFGLISESLRQVVANSIPNSDTIVFNALMTAIETTKGAIEKTDKILEAETITDSAKENEVVPAAQPQEVS